MSQDKLKKMACTACKRINYWTSRRIKGENLEKLILNKFCKHCRAQKEHKELKK
ncbi:50S ribosomal protein L33 [Candidatus Kaiserbacteria bacterium]|nr:MAG: 50S ribosomal protein L33 [Candidatus Kaiserbacteria bacterium]PCI90357.1 MAG: 50S ribosomal protein L33 [Candidatus Kaiserbacteria bacterium]